MAYIYKFLNYMSSFVLYFFKPKKPEPWYKFTTKSQKRSFNIF